MKTLIFVMASIMAFVSLTGYKSIKAQNIELSENDKLSLPFLVLDLDGDGIELLPLEESNIFFDVDGDGKAERTAWVKSDDAFLAIITRDEYQSDMSSIKRFVNNFTGGVKKLQNFDKNNDSAYNIDDYKYFKNQVFRDLIFLVANDKNFDGVPNVDEVTESQCNFISITFSKVNEQNVGTLRCKDKQYSFKEVLFNYEDSNIAWGSICNAIRLVPSKRDEFQRDCLNNGYLSPTEGGR